MQAEKVADCISKWLKDYLGPGHVTGFVVGVSGGKVDLTDAFETSQKTVKSNEINEVNAYSGIAFANMRSRLRMVNLYYYASLNGYLVVGTGNKAEDFGVGFFTKYDNGGFYISPIGDLMKSEVRVVAAALGAFQETIKAALTNDLFGVTRIDEDQI